mmetsp:Transcript_2734/g.6443  ORF Transcript_2734/g.6443 Transcript_2734/m.6443 type:complete len:207 (-) Transcript_2734:388-1008(-)
MATGDGNISDPNIAVVPAPQLQDLFCQGDDVQPSCGVLLGVTDQIFQDDERWRCSRHLNQRHAVLCQVDIRRVRCLAKLARQGPIEIGASAGSVGEVKASPNPVPEASEVDELDRALAEAWRDQRIFLGGTLQQANSAESRRQRFVVQLCRATGAAGIFQSELWLGGRVHTQLADFELETTKFDDIAFGEDVPRRLTIPNNSPKLL